jgi:hypothetical protein
MNPGRSRDTGQRLVLIIGIVLTVWTLSAAARGQETSQSPGVSVPVPGGLYDMELISVMGSYYHSQVAVPDEQSGSDYRLKTTLIGVNASWNRFVTAQVTFGGSLGFSDMIQKTSRGAQSENDQFWFGPRIAYYRGSRAGRWWPYMAAECNFLAARHDDAREPILGFKAGGGIVFRPWPGFGIVLDASYRETTLKTDIAAFSFDLGLAGIID